MNLTGQQKRAACARGSVAVTAGAGTGKTAMLAERFFHHVEADGLRPIEIVAVTFTEKAAAELRQRIRKTLIEKIDDEEKVAEVDAAQISTIHALAARICREFSHLIGISADFRVLLETDSAIWLADKFDDAMSEVDENIIRELHYSWLKRAIGKLLEDPYSANLALARTEAEWRATIEQASEGALSSLLNSAAWQTASDVLPRYEGKGDDKLEPYRYSVCCAMKSIESGNITAECVKVFDGFRSNFGAGKNWKAGLKETQKCLGALRDAFKEWTPLITMKFGPADEIALKQAALLKRAFEAAYRYIREQKKKDKVLDFIDLELYAAEILRNERAQAFYAKRWKALLVDEFQDTNPLQAEIIGRLSQNATLTVVGDEKQSIYGFRRADIDVFRRIRSVITSSDGDSIELSETFRSHESLTAATNDMFEPILGELHQRLEATRKEKPHEAESLSLAIVNNEEKFTSEEARFVESRFIAREIKRMIEEGDTVCNKATGQLRRIAPRDIAILSRRWAPIEVYIDALSAEGIPAVNAGGGNLLQTREASDAIAMLTFLTDPSENISLGAILRSPFFAVSDRVLYELARTKSKDETWWHLIQKSGNEVGRARDILTILLELKHGLSPEDLLREADRLTGYTAVIANLPQGDRREADWMGMISLLREIRRGGRSDLFGTVRQLMALASGDNKIPRPPLDAGDAVTLTTIHNAKGLEWPVVFVPDLSGTTEDWGDTLQIDSDLGVAFEIEDAAGTKVKPAIFEIIKRRSEEREHEEEKRLLYVAVTRARDRVVLTSGFATKTGAPIEFLLPAIEQAQIPRICIPFIREDAVPSIPRDLPQFETPSFKNVEPINIGLATITPTGLTEYAACPKKFMYAYVEGHPGLGEGEARARKVGTIAHKALQFNIQGTEELARIAEGARAELVAEALELANRFRTDPVFKEFQKKGFERERLFSFEYRGIQILGSADLVGGDFVLDYKTGYASDPETYRFQLWAYAKALNKPRAFVANLRDSRLYEFPAQQLTEAGEAADKMIDAIMAGDFDADPSSQKCSRCAYSGICINAVQDLSRAEEQSMAAPGQQLDLF